MNQSDELQKIERTEEAIAQHEEKIEAAEKRIADQERKILAAEREILRQSKRSNFRSLFSGDLSSPERYLVRQMYIKKLAKHKLLFSLLITIGVVLVWRGIWHTADVIPLLSVSGVSFAAGVFILWLVNRYTDLK